MQSVALGALTVDAVPYNTKVKMPKRRNAKTSRKGERGFRSHLLHASYCFLCDELVKNDGVQIVLGRTPYSNVGLPAKIGQLIGDSFIVVVGVRDTMCSRCASLISHLDKLETDARTVKKTLMGYIAAKYQLNHKEICAKIDQSAVVSESYQEVDHNKEEAPTNRKDQQYEEEIQSEPAPTSCYNNTKVTSCDNCDFLTTDEEAFLTHSSSCLRLLNQCSLCGVESFFSRVQVDLTNTAVLYSGTCSSCSKTYDSENEFLEHMATHRINGEKCDICGSASSDATISANHILTHGTSLYHCSLCPAIFSSKSAASVHTGNHLRQTKCPKCSNTSIYQSKEPSNSKLSLTPVEQTIDCKMTKISGDMEKESDLTAANNVECLERSGDFITGGSTIEFHPCPSCGLTFLNKTLFSEHTKMHEPQNEAQMDIPDADEEVLNSTSIPGAGECSIDDDLEDLFEKLHAETSSSTSLVPDQALKSGSSNEDKKTDNTSTSVATNFNAQSTDDDCLLSEATARSDLETRTVESCIVPSRLSIIRSGFDSSKMPAVLQLLHCESDSVPVSMNSSEEGSMSSLHLPAINEPDFVPDGTSTANFTTHEGAEESLGDIFEPSDQQTLIYITGSGDGDSQGMVLHKATIDPKDGNIRLLPYILNGTLPSSHLISSLTDNESSNLGDTQSLEQKQNFCEIWSETDVAQSKLGNVKSVETNAFSCDYCSFQTSIELVMSRHLKIHQDGGVHKCSICNRAFASTQRLLSHLDLRHEGDGPVECPLCTEECDDSRQLRNHLAEKHPAGKFNFLCRFCGEKFSTKRSCKSHEENHSEIFRFQCEVCSKKFSSKEDLEDHVKWIHDKVGQCRFCGKKIDKPKTLKNHELRHMQESNHHECQECKRVFKTKTGLRHHVASHTGQFKFCCDFCGRGFMSRMMLEDHRACHTKEERYICDICGQKFSFQSTYWIHRKWHETPYPYKCNYCGRFFRHSSLLAVHKRKHTGERPYKCPHCPMSFPVGGTLKRHMILHTGVYPFNCELCKRGFTARHKYASHLAKVHGNVGTGFQMTLSDGSVAALPTSTNDAMKLKDLTPNNSESVMVVGSAHTSVVDDGDGLLADQNLPSRIVEIVLDDSYQAVATVTLADVDGNEALLPDNWYG